ncbi:MAG TPA: hypothetical protein VLB27_03730 [candidate division Zixibacteria bacterium]|nr:hypothetical protein [candidate division Zixibacteria bacterium]
MSKELRRLRGEHCLNVFVSYELKERLQRLAATYDRTVADMVRALLKVGIPVMEGISEAERLMMREYVELFRRARKIKEIKEI